MNAASEALKMLKECYATSPNKPLLRVLKERDGRAELSLKLLRSRGSEEGRGPGRRLDT